MSYYDLMSMIEDLPDLIGAFLSTYWIVLVLALLGSYLFMGYAYMCIGKKAGVDGDWMPFLPVARQLYFMRIAEAPWWYIFLFSESGLITGVITVVLGVVLVLLTKGLLFPFIILAAYWIAIFIFTFLAYRKFYGKFRFNPNTAWLVIIPGFGTVDLVFKMLIGFSDVVVKSSGGISDISENDAIPREKAYICGIAGQYEGADFDISDGKEITMGRSSSDCQIVFDQYQDEISRVHCRVRYDMNTNDFYITDCSKLGTYLENGTRLENGVTKRVGRGTVIYLASKRNGFRLDIE